MAEIPLILSVDASKAKTGTDTAKRGLDELKQSARGATDSIKTVEGSFDRLVDAARRFGPALSVTAMVAFTRSALNAADAINDMSKRFGISTEALSKFNYMAKLSGASLESFAQGIKFMQVNIDNASRGVKESVETLARLGLTFTDLKNMRPEERFTLIADRLSEIKDEATLTASAVDLFGRAGANLIPIVRGGADEIKRMSTEAENLGLVLDTQAAEDIARFNDIIDVMTLKLQRLAVEGFLKVNDAIPTAVKSFVIMRAVFNGMIGDTEELNHQMAIFKELTNPSADPAKREQFGPTGESFRTYQRELADKKKAEEEIEKERKKAADEREAAQKKTHDTMMKNLEGQWTFEKFVQDEKKRAAEEQQKAIEEQAKAYEHLAEQMQDTLGDAFYDIATGANNLAETIKKAMIRAAADSAAAWATQQIMPQVMGFIGGGGSSASGGSSGSSLGGTAGSVGTSMAGSGASAALGMSAGMAAAVGAGLLIAAIALPKIIDSFKPRAHPASTFGTEVGQDNVLLNTQYQSKHMGTDYAQGIATLVEGILAGFQAGGTDLSGTTVHGGIDDGHGFLRIADKVVAEFDPSNENSLASALAKFTGELAKSSDVVNLDMVKALQNLSTEGKTLAQVVEEINAALARDMLRKQFNASNVSSYIAGASPEAAALMAEQQSFNAALTTAKELGANTQLLYRVHAQNIAKIQAQYSTLNAGMQETVNTATSLAQQYSSVGESLADAIFGLKTGELSSMSPGDQLALARSQFNTTAAAARMGDVNAMQDLPQLANTFLSLSKQYNASSTAYAADFESVTGALESASATAARQTNIQEQIARNTAAQIAATTSGFSSMAAILSAIANAEKISTSSYTGKTYSSSNANEMVVKNKAAIQAAGLMGVVNSLLDTYSYGTTPGDKRRSEFFAGNASQNSAFIAAARAAGIPGFATGGQHPVGMPYLVGERGPEVRVDRSAGTIIPIQNNDAILREMQQSNRHLSATVVVLKAGMSELIEENKANAKAIRALAEAQSRTRVEKAGRK